MSTSDAIGSCQGLASYVTWSKVGTTTRYAPTMHVQQRNRAKIGLKWQTTQQTKLGIAVVAGADGYQAGLGYAAKQNTNTGFYEQIDTAGFNGNIKMQWEYHQQKEWCHYVDPYGIARSYYMGVYRWKSNDWTSGVISPTSSNRYTCNSSYATNTTANKFWNGTNHSHTFKAMFGIDGVKLDTSYTTATGVLESAERRPAYAHMRLCGWGNYPAQTALYWEIYA